jgi:hypothetical protein
MVITFAHNRIAHETIVHVQLLVAVKQRQAGIIGNKIDFHFLVASQHDHVLDHASGRLAGGLGQFEAVTMQVNRMDARDSGPRSCPSHKKAGLNSPAASGEILFAVMTWRRGSKSHTERSRYFFRALPSG